MSLVEHIRCSSLDSLFACTPSVIDNGLGMVRISPTNDAAKLGNLVHLLAESWVSKGDYDLPGLCNLEGMGQDDQDDAAKLMGYVTRSWDELNRYFPKAMVEKPVESDVIEADDGNKFKITGTCDVLSNIGTNNAIFLDWKTGFLDSGYHQQMAGYAYAIWSALGRPPQTHITGVTVFLRHRYYRVGKYDATKIAQWESDLLRNVLPAREKYRPGKQCRFCDLYATCPARQAVVSNMIDALAPKPVGTPQTEYELFIAEAKELLSGLTKENKSNQAVGEMIETLAFRVRMAQQQIDETKGVIRDAVKRVGAITLPGNISLDMRRVEVNKLEPTNALMLLRKKLSDAEICKAMRLSFPTLMNTYARKFGPKERTAARDQLFQELKDAGALRIEVQHRLEETDITPADEEHNDGESNSERTDHGQPDDGEGARDGVSGGSG